MSRASYQKIPNLTLGQKRAINTPVKKVLKGASYSLPFFPVPVVAPKPQGRTVLTLKH